MTRQVVIPPDRTEDADKALRPGGDQRRGLPDHEGHPRGLGAERGGQASSCPRDQAATRLLELPTEPEDMVLPQRGPQAQLNGEPPRTGHLLRHGGREVSRQETRTAAILGAVLDWRSCAAGSWQA